MTIDIIRKQFAIVREPGTNRVTVSTPGLDRHKDRVLVGQFDITNYIKNPVLLWGHNYQDPYAVIGRASDVQVGALGMSLLPEWREIANDADPMNIIRLLWDTKMVNAFSIGFRPEAWEENTDGGLDYTEGEILEVSLVPVPANADALRAVVRGLGIDGPAWLWEKPLRQFKPWSADEQPYIRAYLESSDNLPEISIVPGTMTPGVARDRQTLGAKMSDGAAGLLPPIESGPSAHVDARDIRLEAVFPHTARAWEAAAQPGLTEPERKQAFLNALLDETPYPEFLSTYIASNANADSVDIDAYRPHIRLDKPEGTVVIECVCYDCGQAYVISATAVRELTKRKLPFYCEQHAHLYGDAPGLTAQAIQRMLEPEPMAWVRRLEVESNLGRHVCLAAFHGWQSDIPEDATKLDFNEEGELVEVPHPDAGKTIVGKDVTFVPPIPFHSEKWGWDDATYAISSGQGLADDEIVATNDWEVLELTPVLLALPHDEESEKAFDLGVCNLTHRSITVAKRMLARRSGLATRSGQEPQGEELDAPLAEPGQDELDAAFAELTDELAEWFRR